ncbi:unnamed protein product [Discosporangium mesarthrocarpum]
MRFFWDLSEIFLLLVFWKRRRRALQWKKSQGQGKVSWKTTPADRSTISTSRKPLLYSSTMICSNALTLNHTLTLTLTALQLCRVCRAPNDKSLFYAPFTLYPPSCPCCLCLI